jgi:hypothetical protein
VKTPVLILFAKILAEVFKAQHHRLLLLIELSDPLLHPHNDALQHSPPHKLDNNGAHIPCTKTQNAIETTHIDREATKHDTNINNNIIYIVQGARARDDNNVRERHHNIIIHRCVLEHELYIYTYIYI